MSDLERIKKMLGERGTEYTESKEKETVGHGHYNTYYVVKTLAWKKDVLIKFIFAYDGSFASIRVGLPSKITDALNVLARLRDT